MKKTLKRKFIELTNLVVTKHNQLARAHDVNVRRPRRERANVRCVRTTRRNVSVRTRTTCECQTSVHFLKNPEHEHEHEQEAQATTRFK